MTAKSTIHDLHNHLAVILGFAELMLADAPRDHPYRTGLEEIRTSAKAALDLVATDISRGGA